METCARTYDPSRTFVIGNLKGANELMDLIQLILDSSWERTVYHMILLRVSVKCAYMYFPLERCVGVARCLISIRWLSFVESSLGFHTNLE